MNIQKAYNEWSASYDSDGNLTRDLDQQVTRDVLANLHFNSILEVGCGTGKNTAFLVQIGTSVHSLDFSQGMIEKAKEKVKAGNVHFDRNYSSESSITSYYVFVGKKRFTFGDDMSRNFREGEKYKFYYCKPGMYEFVLSFERTDGGK